MEKYEITKEEHNSRLDKFLVEQLPNLSRSQIQKIIKSGQILVNNKKTSVHHFLKEYDNVEILETLSFRPSSDVSSEQVEKSTDSSTRCRSLGMTKKDAAGKKIKKPEPKVIFEDKNILVIDKPSGLLVHPRNEELFNQEPTVVSWLIKKFPALKKVGDNLKLRPGIVHRLDKEASGVMVIAKNQKAFEYLKKLFREHLVKKEYRAWIYGQLANNYGQINFPIGRAEEGGRMAARPFNKKTLSLDENQTQISKEALTEFEVLESYPHRSLLKVFPQTGRTHQIRVHFLAMGHPLLGDPIYKIKSFKAIKVPRLMLHAHKLTFKNLDGEKVSFEAPISKEFKLD